MICGQALWQWDHPGLGEKLKPCCGWQPSCQPSCLYHAFLEQSASPPGTQEQRQERGQGGGAGDGLAQTAVSELNISPKAILLDGQSVVAQKVRCMLQL